MGDIVLWSISNDSPSIRTAVIFLSQDLSGLWDEAWWVSNLKLLSMIAQVRLSYHLIAIIDLFSSSDSWSSAII